MGHGSLEPEGSDSLRLKLVWHREEMEGPHDQSTGAGVAIELSKRSLDLSIFLVDFLLIERM